MTATNDVDTYLQQRASGEAAPPVPGGNGTSTETETVAVASIEDAPPLTAPLNFIWVWPCPKGALSRCS